MAEDLKRTRKWHFISSVYRMVSFVQRQYQILFAQLTDASIWSSLLAGRSEMFRRTVVIFVRGPKTSLTGKYVRFSCFLFVASYCKTVTYFAVFSKEHCNKDWCGQRAALVSPTEKNSGKTHAWLQKFHAIAFHVEFGRKCAVNADCTICDWPAAALKVRLCSH